MAVNWAKDLQNLSSVLTGKDSEDTAGWDETVQHLREYFQDKEIMAETVQGWSLEIWSK